MRRALACAMAILAAPASAQQDLGHRFSVTPSVAKAAIGDPITLRFSVDLHERDLITDSVPRPAGELPDGVRILEVRKLTRRTHRTLEGTAKVAFYRPGARQLPTFEIPFLRVSANLRGTIKSEPDDVEIAPVAPPGNPSLKDLKDLAPVGGVDWLPIGVGAAVLGVGALALRVLRRRARKLAPAPLPASPPAHLPDPYESALARLAALERTTAELLRALPPHLVAQGNRERLSALLGDADLVKFAQARTPPAAGSAFRDAARALLTSWRAAAQLPSGTADATG